MYKIYHATVLRIRAKDHWGILTEAASVPVDGGRSQGVLLGEVRSRLMNRQKLEEL